MSHQDTEPPSETEGTAVQDPESLQTQVAVLKEENRRLREEYARARKASYRRSASALLGVGCLAVLAGVVLTGVRDVLFVLGAIGIFGGILSWYITPDRVLSVTVSDGIYQAVASNGTALVEELGLQSRRIYAPTERGVRLVVPQHAEFELPDSLSSLFLTERAASRAVALTPTGGALVREGEQLQRTESPESLRAAVELWGDMLVEQFEVADAVTVTESAGDDKVVVSVTGAAFGPLTEFDHPVVSVLGCGLARATDSAIEVEQVDDSTIAFERVQS